MVVALAHGSEQTEEAGQREETRQDDEVELRVRGQVSRGEDIDYRIQKPEQPRTEKKAPADR